VLCVLQECLDNSQCGTCEVCTKNACMPAAKGFGCALHVNTTSTPGVCTAPAADDQAGTCVECTKDDNCSGSTTKCNLASNTCVVRLIAICLTRGG
jgi:hypothetical protein